MHDHGDTSPGTAASGASEITEAISAHHRELSEHIEAEVAAIEAGTSDGAGLASFLTNELLPHASGEERFLYPAVSPLIAEHGNPTETMTLDHEYIGNATRRIETLVGQLRGATDDATRERLHKQLVRAAVQIEAVVGLHTTKEERAYLPLIARYLDAGQQRRLLEEMHEAANSETARTTP